MTVLNLLMVTETPATGCGRHLLDLCGYLVGQGHQVSMVLPLSKASATFRNQASNISFKQCFDVPLGHSVGLHDLTATAQVRRIVRGHGPYHIIHGHSSKGGAIVRLSGIGTRSKIVYTPHSFVTQHPELHPVKRFFYGAIERTLSYLSDAVITVAEQEKSHAETLGIPQDKCFVIRNEIDPPPETDFNAVRANVRAELGLSPNELVFVSVGRLCQQKAYHRIISAFAVVRQIIPEARLVLIGGGEQLKSLSEQARTIGVADDVLFTGERFSLPLLPAFDVYVQCSTFEGCSYSMLEALGCGLPMITTSVGSTSELLSDDEGGYIVPNGTPDTVITLARRMLDLARTPSLREQMGKRNRELISGQSVGSMARSTLALYRHLLDSGRADAV